MTEFHVEAVRLKGIQKHPNADSLSIATIHDAYPVIFKTGEYSEGELVAYIPVDSIVPATEEWQWLAPAGAALRDKERRIKAKKLRGVFSMGLIAKLPPVPGGWNEGESVAASMGITKYDPDAEVEQPKPQPRAKRPKGLFATLRWAFYAVRNYFFPKAHYTNTVAAPKLKHLPGVYDIEPFRKFGKSWFQDGERVVVTEKIHGQNASFVHDGKKLHIKSRTRWRRNDPTEPQNTWAKVAAKYGLEKKLAEYPGLVIFGETYGNNGDMPYGVDRAKNGDDFRVFDMFDTERNRWFGHHEVVGLCQFFGLQHAPVLGFYDWKGESTYDALLPLAEGKSTIQGANHIREGFVIKPTQERNINGGQRVILKMAGESYLTRKTA